MKFRLKITLCMIWLLSLSFGIGGSLMIGSSFSSALSQEKAAAELAASQARAKCFAERQGLNVEDEKTSRAIAELDYKAIAEMAMEHDAPKGDGGYAVASSLVTDGFEMKGGKYDDLLAPAN